ncbi:DUF998 domain-containing protein [Actinomadura flavalba]|uniref:DUF998 domain-containing protein n=1 Tax=Actinomadura flavalba TaxID=1120938 RepID=UPI00037AF63F|nr:DUF998 domain-containing protein [Actinomadura flavalba]
MRLPVPTPALLAAGVAATPLFVAVAVAQAVTRDGFELGPHMASQLSAGEHGWMQIANFLVTGVLFLAAAAGFRRALPDAPGRIWAPRLIAAFGGTFIASGLFVADPAAGYPVGAAEGTTWHGVLHGVSAALSGVVVTAALLVLARHFSARGSRPRAITSIVAAVVFLIVPWTVPGQTGLLLLAAAAFSWGWLSFLAADLLRTPAPAEPQTPRLAHA